MMLGAAAHLGAGLLASSVGWLLLRWTAGAGRTGLAALMVDGAVPLLCWLLFLGVTGRPIFAGFLVLGLAAGLALADVTKREVLREPLVFADMAELPFLFTHPELYVPFAGKALVYGGALAIFASLAAVYYAEAPLWHGLIWPPVLGLGGLVLGSAAFMNPPLLGLGSDWLRRLRPSGAPLRDAREIGPLASLFTYGMIARAERPARQAAARPASPGAAAVPRTALPTIVMVQNESFFDARRMSPAIAPGLLPGFDRCCREARACGLFSVPGWGANTVRSEFSAIAGLADEAIGYDRFNPYHAFARRPIRSLAWTLRARGYRTLCLHPFDRRFYRRDIVMPNLGFDAFIGIEGFRDAPRANGYVTDLAVARKILELAEADGAGLFIFAITMENHGPWSAAELPPSLPDFAPALERAKHHQSLRRFLASLANADAMVTALRDGLAARGHSGLLAFYGDHLPSLPRCFDEFGFGDPRTDYFVWRAEGGQGVRRDLAAHELPAIILGAVGD